MGATILAYFTDRLPYECDNEFDNPKINRKVSSEDG